MTAIAATVKPAPPVASALEEEGAAIRRRYILFVGNLPYKASADDIKKHFRAAGEASVRLMTDKKTRKPKGFAFVEFPDLATFTKGLAYHHTTFMKRQINVEMTSGGGGNSATRKSKIEAKNHELDVKRKKAYAAKGSTDGEQSVAGGHGDGHDVAAGAVSAPHKKGKLRVDGDVAFNARILASGPNSVAVAKKRKSASTHAPPAAASTTKKQRTAPSYETPQK